MFSQLLTASARAPQAKPNFQSVGGNLAVDLVAAASLRVSLLLVAFLNRTLALFLNVLDLTVGAFWITCLMWLFSAKNALDSA